MHTNLIGISGKRGSGKDEVVKIIQRLQPEKNWQVLRFSEGVKNTTAVVTGLPVAMMHTQEGKATYVPHLGMTVGEVQQKIGDGLRGIVHTNVWVFATLALIDPDKNYLIPDVRYPNELGAVEEAGGVVLRLNGNPVGQQGDGTRDDAHASECALDDHPFTFPIDNTGSLAELDAKVTKFLLVELPVYFPSDILPTVPATSW